MERDARVHNPMIPLPRVCVALRWREARSWRMVGEERSVASEDGGRKSAHDDASRKMGSFPSGADRRGDGPPTPPSGSNPSDATSRLCVLRRRYPIGSSSRSVSEALYQSGCQPPWSADLVLPEAECVVVGLGMRGRDASATTPSLPSASAQTATMEVVVQTPLIAVEGITSADAAAQHGMQQHWSHRQDHPHRCDSSSLTYTDACLTASMADVIAKELLQGTSSLRCGGVAGGKHLSSSVSTAAQATPGESSEVVTFTMGPQGAGNTSFLFGGTLAWPPVHRASAVAVPPSTQRGGGLFAAVLNRLFTPGSVPAGTRVIAAMCVTEVRDADPLRHSSVLQRPRLTVDLLSGAILRTEVGEARENDDSLDQPTDIPAACYVRVESVHDAMTVLYSAFSSSVGWRCRDSRAAEAGGSVTCPSSSPSYPSPPSPSTFLEPTCEPLEERECHTCVTLIVSFGPSTPPQHLGELQQHASGSQRVATNFGINTSQNDGSFDSAALPPEASAVPTPVGIWKLWDLAGPSVSCGYRPLVASSGTTGERGGLSPGQRTTAAAAGGERAASAQPLTPRLPWSNRYSLAALTHTCLAEVGCTLGTSAFPMQTSSVDNLVPILRHDPSVALQIASSAVSSCTLVVPICSVVAEVTLDDVNSEVLAAAAGWTALGREGSLEQQRGYQRPPRERGLDNADAARRVLGDYTVHLMEFLAERYNVGDLSDSGSAFPAISPSLFFVAPRLLPNRTDEGADKIQEVECAPLELPVHSPRPTDTAAGRSVTPTASRHSDLPPPVGGFPMSAVCISPGAAVHVPLSINETADAEMFTDLSRGGSSVEAGKRFTTPVRHSNDVFSHAPGDLCTGSTGRYTHNLIRLAATPATPPTSVAATCAAAAAVAEEARLLRFHHIFESESFENCEGADATRFSEVVDPHTEASAICTGDNAEHHGPHSLQTPLSQQTPLVKGSGSPPSVLQTRLRRGAATPGHKADLSEEGRPLLLSTPVRLGVGSPVHDSMEDNDLADVPAPPAQALLYDIVASEGVVSSAREVESTLVCGATLDVGAKSTTHISVSSVPPPHAALVSFLRPYCDEFSNLYDQMRADICDWKAHEAITLDQLSAVADRHTRDLQKLSALQRRLNSTSGALGTGSAATEGSRLLGDSRGEAAASALVRDTAHDDVDSLAATRSATFASTSALIFEQLVNSEEKVAWLERQLVQWRRRAHEASVFDAGGGSTASEEDDQRDRDPLSSPAAVGLGGSVASKSLGNVPGEDPTEPHLHKAKTILKRLLKQCAHAYAAAQQRGERWHAQLVHEKAAKSALQKRVIELEMELAELRRQHGSATASLHHHGPPVPTGETNACGAYTGTTSVLPSHFDSAGFTAVSIVPTALSNCAHDDRYGYATREHPSLTAASVSTIASDNTLSLPSCSASHVSQRRDTHAIESAASWGRAGAQPRSSQRADRVGGAEVFPTASVAPQLAVLLSRAVQGGVAPTASATIDSQRVHADRSSTSTGAPASLFEVRVGVSSTAPSRGDDSPSLSAEPRSSSPAIVSLDGGAPRMKERPTNSVHEVRLRNVRQCHRQSSPPQHEWQVQPSTALSLIAHRTGHEIGDDAGGRGGAWQHHWGTKSSLLHRGAVAPALRPAPSQYPDVSVEDLEVYPSAALGALGKAAAELEVEAVRLCRACYTPSDATPGGLLHTTAMERGQHRVGDELTLSSDADTRFVSPLLSSSLCESVGRLRSATQSVQREARDAAERERAYLSAILFSPTNAKAE